MVGLLRSARRMLSGVDGWATDLLLPPRCAWCDSDLPSRQSVPLCNNCLSLLGAGCEGYSCGRCGTPWHKERRETPCPVCAKTRFRFDSVVCLGPYRDTLRDAILKMKHPQGEYLARTIGRLIVDQKGGELRGFEADCVIPVPMYWGRRIWRGVNGPQAIAEEIAALLAIPALPGMVARRRNTIPQKDLGHAGRFRNVRGAFALSGGYGLEATRILIVDDIMTTGATSSEVAKTLKNGGASAVTAVIVGRAGHPL